MGVCRKQAPLFVFCLSQSGGTMSQPTVESTIPQSVLDQYNRQFNNRTYRAFSDRLKRLTAGDTDCNEPFIDTALNLLIDASLGRAGASFYQEAEHSLLAHLRPANTDLVPLALTHLANFGPPPHPLPVAPEEHVQAQLTAAQGYAEDAARAASDLPAWRGRVAFMWASAAAYILQAASAILVESHYDSYPLEKLDRGLAHFRNGASEAHSCGFRLSAPFVDWVKACPRARD
jgi:hypothetical protein